MNILKLIHSVSGNIKVNNVCKNFFVHCKIVQHAVVLKHDEF